MIKILFFDLKHVVYYGHNLKKVIPKGVTNVYWKNNFFSTYELLANVRISKMCQPLSRQLQSKIFFMFRSISLYGFCSTYFSRKLARYRDLPSFREEQALSYGDPKPRLTKYSIQRQRKKKLEDLWRLCSTAYEYSQRFICWRRIFPKIKRNSLRLRCYHNKIMSFSFPWAYFQKGHAGIKLHTLLNLRSNIPSFARITRTQISDHNILDELTLEPGAFYIMDRGYIDFSRLYMLHLSLVYFVIRNRCDIKWRRLYSRPVDKLTGLRCDQTIVFTGRYSEKDYPEKIRRICFFDLENKSYLDFLTNNFRLSALTIAQLYKCRWQVELFFKWIKQHLRIKKFYGISENAIKTQIWIAISVYVLVAIVKKHLKLKLNLYTILQVLSVTAFEKVPLVELFTDSNIFKIDDKQLLFEF